MTDHLAQQLGNYRLVRHLGRGALLTSILA